MFHGYLKQVSKWYMGILLSKTVNSTMKDILAHRCFKRIFGLVIRTLDTEHG